MSGNHKQCNEDLAAARSSNKSSLNTNSLDTRIKHQELNNNNRAHNLLFILTDQERYLKSDSIPKGYSLPGRERLKRQGVEFTNHQINSAVCTSSRSVIYTGRHIQQTQMYDNLDFPWTNDLDPNIGTLGHMLNEAGYYSAYKGKWHLSDLGDLGEQSLPDPALTKILESYGFHDYVGIGDVIGMVQGGWINDELIAAQAQRWLRVKGNPMTHKGQPWFLAVNLVNPHDVMFYNTDAPNEHIQDTPAPMIGLSREPNTSFYKQQWEFKLPTSRKQSFTKLGRPPAHQEYQIARDTQVGAFPNEDSRWQRLLNYYYNCILDTDRMVMTILDELEALGLMENTIVVLTSDHGELAGAHGNHGKGATAYQEQNHVPLIISHPDYPETYGQQCQALTSHLDLAPTMMSWAQVNNNSNISNNENNGQLPLPGKDLTPLLALAEKAHVNQLREGTLYCYNMFAYLDSSLLIRVQSLKNQAMNKSDEITTNPPLFEIDFSKRGAIRSVFDGRYKFTRYFAPKEHNRPETIEDLFELNDVELFDLQNDPNEMYNLAVDPQQHKDLLLEMNAKLNTLIEEEVSGGDDGSYLPIDKSKWSADEFGWN